VPAFAPAAGGVVPTHGVVIGEPARATADGAAAFSDPWMQARGHKGDRPGERSPKGGRDA
jgi:hypothetical protein